MIKIPTIDNIQNARRRIAPFIHQTPIFTSTTLNAISSKTLYFKCENLQKTGSFKARGATNATRLMWECMKIIVEPSAAVPLAALWQNLDSIPEKKIGIIVSGGNMDLKSLRLFNPERQEN
jgi:threonine dehydratase